jgi:DNA-binding GntR family transcriptional regulator
VAIRKQKRAQPVLPERASAPEAAPRRRNRLSLFELAYDRIEEMIVKCELKPGDSLTMQELQTRTGFGRTPLHQAVSRLAADTLIIVRPRHGLQIAPIDLARERVLLRLRRDVERFVIRLAAERSGPMHRNQMLHMNRMLRERRDEMGIDEFNLFDRRFNQVIVAAAGEPFLEHTLRPLHTIFRRIGWIHCAHFKGAVSLHQTIDCHLAVLDAVGNRHIEEAVARSDELIDFVDSMFDTMEREVDPSLLDCSIEPLLGS